VRVKICHISSVSDLTARVFYRECVHSAELGYQVCLIRAGAASETRNGVELVGYRSGTGALSRLLAAPFALRAALKQKADIYHLHTPQMLPIGWILKVVFRKKVVYDIFEDFPSMALTKEKLPLWIRKSLGALLYGVESASCRLFDGIVTADPSVMRMYARSATGPRIVFYNLPSLRLFARAEHDRQTKRYDIVYSGGISERTGIYVLLEAIQQLVASGLKPRVLIFGYFDSDASSAKLRDRISELRLDEFFEIKGKVTPPEVPVLLSQARIGVVPLQPIPKFLKNIPTKLFDYWACGLATVVSDLPPIRPFIGNNSFGFKFDPGAPQQLANALAWLIHNPERTHQMGQDARQAILTRLNTDCERKRLADFYERVMGNTYTAEYARAAA